MSTFTDYGQAQTYAAINGCAIDAQDDYCEACRAYHVGCDHADEVPKECGAVSVQGYEVILECKRPPHEGGEHRNLVGNTWQAS